MRLNLAVLAILASLTPARAEPIALRTEPIPSFQNLSGNTTFGALTWRGGLSLESDSTAFGGLSGLVVADDCNSLVAVSDAGRWFTANLAYDARNHLNAISNAKLAPMLDSKGKPPRRKVDADAEAIAALGKGKYLVGFESRTRTGTYDLGKSGFAARFQSLKSPKAFSGGPSNGELESIGFFTDGPQKGRYLAVSEKNRDAAGNIRGWLWRKQKTVPFTIKRLVDYDITDLALLPGGDVLILERSFSTTSLPGMAIRRFPSSAIKSKAVVLPTVIFEGRVPFYAIDNMEGIALCSRGGETRVTIMSDNNFNTALQRTLLLQFSYEP